MMTIDEMLVVLQAYKEGKEIQFKNFSHAWPYFKDGEEPCWDFASNHYVVKPE